MDGGGALKSPENTFESWDDFVAIGDAITRISSFERMSEPLDLGGGFLNVVKEIGGKALKAAVKIFDLVDKAIKTLKAAITAGYSLLTVFAQLSVGSGEFADGAKPRAYDVNG